MPAQRQLTPKEEQELQQMMTDLDKMVAETKPHYLSGAMQGAVYGLAYGFLANKPARGNRLKYAAWGAGIVVGVQFLARKFMTGGTAWMHRETERLYPGVVAPRSPVVTSGYFAGLPRPLYHAGVSPYTGGANSYYVGAPPAGGDYSFTRRPGFNSKEY